MYFEQFYLSCLAHASYMLASDGIAVVVDPQRDVDLYIDEAAKQGFRIAYVIETHLHADFVSGHRELAARTGATIYLGAKAGATFPHVDVFDGDELTFGQCKLRFLETPGHTPESICILVSDVIETPEAFALLTGDTLFIGDVGRPDLSDEFTPRQLAGMLYDSLHNKILTLADDVKVYPAHGAGSLCGRQIGAEKFSTVGLQKLGNYACQPMSREAFIDLLTTDLPVRPDYFAQDVAINRTGASALSEQAPLVALTEIPEAATVLDTRPAHQYGAAHIPGSIHIALGGQFAAWAGTILGLDKTIVLVTEDLAAAQEASLRLARVGIEKVAGYLDGGIADWKGDLASIPQIGVQEIASVEGLQILDVRLPTEYAAGTMPNAVQRPLDSHTGTIEQLDKHRPVLVHCKSGYRSSIATSLLERAGFKDVLNLVGGYDAVDIHQPAKAN